MEGIVIVYPTDAMNWSFFYNERHRRPFASFSRSFGVTSRQHSDCSFLTASENRPHWKRPFLTPASGGHFIKMAYQTTVFQASRQEAVSSSWPDLVENGGQTGPSKHVSQAACNEGRTVPPREYGVRRGEGIDFLTSRFTATLRENSIVIEKPFSRGLSARTDTRARVNEDDFISSLREGSLSRGSLALQINDAN